MMIRLLYFLFLLPVFLTAQETKNRFSAELSGELSSGIGENFIADGLESFTGFRLGASGIFYKNFGVGGEFSRTYANVKDVSVFGSLKTSVLTGYHLYFLYNHQFNNKFEMEGNAGFGQMNLKSSSSYRSGGFQEGGPSYLLGAKALYKIDDKGTFYVFAGPRVYFYNSSVKINNPEIEKYYSQATLFNISAGIRIYF